MEKKRKYGVKDEKENNGSKRQGRKERKRKRWSKKRPERGTARVKKRRGRE